MEPAQTERERCDQPGPELHATMNIVAQSWKRTFKKLGSGKKKKKANLSDATSHSQHGT